MSFCIEIIVERNKMLHFGVFYIETFTLFMCMTKIKRINKSCRLQCIMGKIQYGGKLER